MQIDPNRLMELNQPLPRYTSYPTTPEWGPLNEALYKEHLKALGASRRPLSLYVHIPFCRTMCLYCACSVVLNRRPEKEERYIDYLEREIASVSHHLGNRATAAQLHFGGGTPTQLSEELLERLMNCLVKHFILNAEGELSIEIDPRTVATDGGSKLRLLRHLGFNRVSFGVQDTDNSVQEAVRRRQSLAVTQETYHKARHLGFSGINIDLIYGLPLQTQESFRKTVEEICKLRPDRVALFSYAKVPWLKSHQKAIPERLLPSTAEKFAIYCEARERFLEASYVQIGMDHFVLPEDSMAVALRQRQLQRNFQGYSLQLADDLVGFGMTATGFVRDLYVQNVKSLQDYYAFLDRTELPIFRGKLLSFEDRMRKWVIHRLMSDFELDKVEFERRFGRAFDRTFSEEQPALQRLIEEGLLESTQTYLRPTLYGSLLIRNVVATFDTYLKKNAGQFSRAI